MKVSNILNKIPESGYKSRLLSYPTLYVLALLMPVLHRFIFYFTLDNPDSASYVNAIESLKEGRVDMFRTPGYPFFLAFMQIIFGEYLHLGVFVFQFMCFLASIPLFSCVAMRIIRLKKLVYWLTAFYALQPGIGQYYHTMVPEMFTIICMILLLYFSILKQDNKIGSKATIYTFAVLFVLISLKPVFVYLIIAVVIYYILIYKSGAMQSRRVLSVAIICASIICGALGMYYYKVNQRYGIRSISVVTIYNDYIMTRLITKADPKYMSSETGKECFSYLQHNASNKFTAGKCWEELMYMQQYVSLNEVAEYNQKVKEDNRQKILKIYYQRLLQDETAFPILFEMKRNAGLDNYLAVNLEQIEKKIYPSLLQCILFCIVFLIISMRIWIKKHTMPVNNLYLFMIVFGLITTSVIGAYDSYSRLCVAAFPAFLIMIGITVQWICNRKYLNAV